MDILACAHLAFGQSNLRNKWLLENAPVRGSCASRGSQDFSLFSAGYVGVSHTISWWKCQSNLLPRDMPLAHKDTTELPSTSHRSTATQHHTFARWSRREREARCTTWHTKITRTNARTHYVAYSQFSRVCANHSDLSLRLSFLISASTRRETQLLLLSLQSVIPNSHLHFVPSHNTPLPTVPVHSRTNLTVFFKKIQNAFSNLSNRSELQHERWFWCSSLVICLSHPFMYATLLRTLPFFYLFPNSCHHPALNTHLTHPNHQSATQTANLIAAKRTTAKWKALALLTAKQKPGVTTILLEIS